jgi:hypothetical protein
VIVTSDLDVLVPPSQSVELGGQRFTVGPLVIGELPAMLKAVRPFADKLSGDPDWLLLLCEHGDALLEAIAIASRRPREWVDALAIDEAMTLAAAVFEVNVDFFVSRVAPKISDLATKLNARPPGATSFPA